jgi:hypothetical protein
VSAEELRDRTRGLPYWVVRRHPDGGYSPIPARWQVGDEPKAIVTDPSYPDPWLALESIAPANTDKLFLIHYECADGTWITGDLADIAKGAHRK